MPQRGADGALHVAGCLWLRALFPRRKMQAAGISPIVAMASLRRFSNPACLQQVYRHHQPASRSNPIFGQTSLPDIILTKTRHFSSTSLRAIRSQQRCNLDARRGAAYTSYLWTLPALLREAAWSALGRFGQLVVFATKCHSKAVSLHRICENGEADGDAPV